MKKEERDKEFSFNLLCLYANQASASLYYAQKTLKSRFELGEPIISLFPKYSFFYAEKVIGGRFELGEKAISKDKHLWERYKKEILKKS